MAWLIQTGKHDAIPLTTLHSQEVLELDEKATAVIMSNGGYADFTLKMWRGVITALHLNNVTHILHKKVPSA